MELFKRLPLPPSLPHICPGQPWVIKSLFLQVLRELGWGQTDASLAKTRDIPRSSEKGPLHSVPPSASSPLPRGRIG